VLAFTAGTTTYVVASGGTATAVFDDVLILNGVSGITQLGGTTAATGNIVSTAITGSTLADVSTVGTLVTDATGYAVASYSGVLTTGTTHTFNNLAASAVLNSSATGTYNLTTSQAGTAGQNSLTLALDSAASTITTATIVGDNALSISSATGVHTITTLVDSGNTLATLNISGAVGVTIGAITDTALATINVTNTGVVLLGATATPLTQAGLVVNYGTAAIVPATGSAIFLSGAGAKIDAHFTASAVAPANITLSALGDNSIVLGGAATTTSGLNIAVGANGTVTMLQGVAAAVGVAAVTGDAGTNTIKVGANSTVTLGTTSAGVPSDAGSTITVTGDTYGTAGNMVTITSAKENATKVVFAAAALVVDVTGGLVNVATATTLADALNLAASHLGGSTAATHYVDYFQFAGNTYVLDHVGTGAAATAIASGDIVVKLTGLTTLANLADDGSAATGILL